MADIMPYGSGGLAVGSNSYTVNSPAYANDPEEQWAAFMREFEVVLADSAQYILRINDMDDARFCRWMGQSADGRKWSQNTGSQPFPWEGASDSRIWLVDDTVNDNVRIMMAALRRGRMQAKPTNYLDAPYAQAVSIVLDYVLKNEMDHGNEWFREMTFAAQWQEHVGCSVVQVDWLWETGTEWKVITIQDLIQIGQQNPQIMAILQYVGKNPESLTQQDLQQLGSILQQIWPGIGDPRVALLHLQHDGAYGFENPIIKQSRPQIYAMAPFRDCFFPLNTWDIQKARWVVRRDMKNEVDLAEAAELETWDPDFLEQIKAYKGQSVLINYINSHRAQLRRNKDLFVDEFREMYEVFYAYYQIWENGVRKTKVMPFHPAIHAYAQQSLLPYEHGEYPFHIFRRDYSTRSIVESRGVADISEPAQNELKTQRDSRTDRTSYATMPPLAKPLSRGKTKFSLGPSVEVTEVRPGEIHFLEIPPMDQTTILVEQATKADHDNYFGKENPAVAPQKIIRVQQEIADNFLGSAKSVVKQIGKLCQQFMSPQEWTSICHSRSTPFYAITSEEIRKNFHLQFDFDVKDLDMEMVQQKMEAVQIAAQMDQTGTINKDAMVRWVITSVDPMMADAILNPPNSQSQKEISDEQDDLLKIANGIQPPMPTVGINAPLRLQVLQQTIAQSPKLQQLFASDQMAVAILKSRVQALQFQIQQQQNAQIGRVGAAPAIPGAPGLAGNQP